MKMIGLVDGDGVMEGLGEEPGLLLLPALLLPVGRRAEVEVLGDAAVTLGVGIGTLLLAATGAYHTDLGSHRIAYGLAPGARSRMSAALPLKFAIGGGGSGSAPATSLGRLK